MLSEENRRKLAQTLISMRAKGESDERLKLFSSAFNKKYDTPETPKTSYKERGGQPVQVAERPKEGFLQSINPLNMIKKSYEGAKEGFGDVKESLRGARQAKTPLEQAGYGAETAGRLLSTGIKAVYDPIAEPIFETAKLPFKAIKALSSDKVNEQRKKEVDYMTGSVKQMAQTEPVQNIASKYQDLSPRTKKNIAAGAEILTSIPLGGAAKAGLKGAGEVAESVTKKVAKDIFKAPKVADNEIAQVARDVFGLSGAKKQGTTKGIIKQTNDQVDVIKEIVKASDELDIKDAQGNRVDHNIPKNREEYGSMFQDFKDKVYRSYASSNPNAKVDLTKIADDVAKKLDNPEMFGILNANTSFKNTIEKQLANLRKLGITTARIGEGYLQGLNQMLRPVFAGGAMTESKEALYLITNRLRNTLDDVMLSEGNTLYRTQKDLYGKMANITKQIEKAARKNPQKGIVDRGLDSLFGGEILAGAMTANPALMFKGAASSFLKGLLKKIGDPNRKLSKLFEKMYKSMEDESILSLSKRQSDRIKKENARIQSGGELMRKQALEQTRLQLPAGKPIMYQGGKTLSKEGVNLRNMKYRPKLDKTKAPTGIDEKTLKGLDAIRNAVREIKLLEAPKTIFGKGKTVSDESIKLKEILKNYNPKLDIKKIRGIDDATLKALDRIRNAVEQILLLPEGKTMFMGGKSISDEMVRLMALLENYNPKIDKTKILSIDKNVEKALSDIATKRSKTSVKTKVLETNQTVGTPKQSSGNIGEFIRRQALKGEKKVLPNVDSGKAGLEIKNPKAKKISTITNGTNLSADVKAIPISNYIGKNAKTFNKTKASKIGGVYRQKIDQDIRITDEFRKYYKDFKKYDKIMDKVDKYRKVGGEKLKNARGEAFDYLGEMNIKRASLRDWFDYPSLYEAYPELKNLKVEFLLRNTAEKNLAGQILFNGGKPKKIKIYGNDIDDIKGVLKHELQHYIQSVENWQMGGNLLAINDPYIRKQVLTQYRDEMLQNPKYRNIVKVGDVEYMNKVIDKVSNYKVLSDTDIKKIFGNDEEARKRVLDIYSRLFGEVEARGDFSNVPENKRLNWIRGGLNNQVKANKS